MSGARLLNTLRSGRRAFGIPVRSPDPAVLEICAIAGYDWVSITLEHAALTVADIATLQRAADFRGITTLIHLHGPTDNRILALLDAGVGGVVGVHVETAEDARRLVHAARFPPLGERGAAPVTRRSDYGNQPYENYVVEAEREVVVGVVIETARGVENAEEILAVPGLTFVYVGLHDLSHSIGVPGEFGHGSIREAIKRVASCARRHNVALGLTEKGGYSIADLCELGATMIINAPAGDYASLLDGLRSRLEISREEVDAAP